MIIRFIGFRQENFSMLAIGGGTTGVGAALDSDLRDSNTKVKSRNIMEIAWFIKRQWDKNCALPMDDTTASTQVWWTSKCIIAWAACNDRKVAIAIARLRYPIFISSIRISKVSRIFHQQGTSCIIRVQLLLQEVAWLCTWPGFTSRHPISMKIGSNGCQHYSIVIVFT